MLMLAYTGMETHVDATAAMSRRPQESPCSGRPSMFYPVRWVAENGPFEVRGRWSGGAPGHPENPDGNGWLLADIGRNTLRAWECKKMVVGQEVTGDQGRQHAGGQRLIPSTVD